MAESGRRVGPATVARSVAVVSTLGLLAVVLGLATVAVVAEFNRTWTWYFRMEQAMAVAEPAAIAFLVLGAVGYFGTVAFADRD
ncbi:MAG: hypothetical protein ABEH47_03565 [Haloferacaceae archaeon]